MNSLTTINRFLIYDYLVCILISIFISYNICLGLTPNYLNGITIVAFHSLSLPPLNGLLR